MILFLDFDGVLHPVRSNIDDIFCRTPLLDQFLIHEMPEWRIVLSTSWREPHSMDELLDFIPESLHHRILGTTVPDNHPGPREMDPLLFQRSPRQAQILHYHVFRVKPLRSGRGCRAPLDFVMTNCVYYHP